MIETKQGVIDEFHQLHYEGAQQGGSWGDARWHGTKLWKSPSDLWLYQEIICEIRPALLIETGTAFGGSALFFAHQFDQIGHGRVLSIDINMVKSDYPRHPRISYLGGLGSTHSETLRQVRLVAMASVAQGPTILSLDSDHAKAHVSEELKHYAQYVTPNSYLVVEDTNVNGHPVYPEHGPGPWEAVEEWLPHHPEFVEDKRLPQRWLFSYHRWFKRRRG